MTAPPPGQDPWATPPGRPQPGRPPQHFPQQGGYPQPGYPPPGYPPPGYPAPGARSPLPPPPRRGRNALILSGSLLALLLLAGALFATLGPRSSAPSTAGGAQSGPTGTATGDGGGRVSVDVAVGGCIHLGGTADEATADPATCGSAESNYKVVGTAPSESGCVDDVDAAYYETEPFGGGEAGALCLDVDWVEGDCFSLPAGTDGDPARVGCASAGPGDVQVQQTLRGATDLSGCAEDGYVYRTREVVVCLAEPRTS